jgi:hypothetical protein
MIPGREKGREKAKGKARANDPRLRSGLLTWTEKKD